MTLGIQNAPAQETVVKKKPTKKELLTEPKLFNKEEIMENLAMNQALLINNRPGWKTLVRIAAEYNLTDKDFKAKCSEDKELINRLTVYNSLILESLMMDAIKTGKVNNHTDGYLREEMQAYTNTGAEQTVHWYTGYDDEVKVYKLADKNRADYSEEIEIEPDVDKVIDNSHETIFDTMEKLDENN